MSRPLIKRVDVVDDDPILIPFVLDDGERGWLSMPPRPLTRAEGERLKMFVDALISEVS